VGKRIIFKEVQDIKARNWTLSNEYFCEKGKACTGEGKVNIPVLH
jgi:hypothetical protein